MKGVSKVNFADPYIETTYLTEMKFYCSFLKSFGYQPYEY